MEHGRGDAEVGRVLRLWSRFPRCRESGARVGVLEDVLAARIFRGRVAATPRLQRGYSEGRYLGRSEADEHRSLAMGVLGGALAGNGRPEEALAVLKAQLALCRRYWPNAQYIHTTQCNIASCLTLLGRHDEALVFDREIYERRVATSGVSHESTILSGNNLVVSLRYGAQFSEAKTLLREQLLPVARQSLGSDHNLTLTLSEQLSEMLEEDPAATSDDLRFNRHRPASTISTQATTCSKPRQSCRTLSGGDGGSLVPCIRKR